MPWSLSRNGVGPIVRRDHHLLAAFSLVVILLDQISKFLVNRTLQLYESIPVIEGIFNIVHIRNRGMAFGLMNRPDMKVGFYFLVVATIGAIIFMVFWYNKLKNEYKRLTLGFALILGGAIGNLIDRIRLREVIDFLDLYFGRYHWPSFNVADSAITVGALWVAIHLLFFENVQKSKPDE